MENEKKLKRNFFVISAVISLMMVILACLMIISGDHHYKAEGSVILILVIGLMLMASGVCTDFNFAKYLGLGVMLTMLGCYLSLEDVIFGEFISVFGVGLMSATCVVGLKE